MALGNRPIASAAIGGFLDEVMPNARIVCGASHLSPVAGIPVLRCGAVVPTSGADITITLASGSFSGVLCLATLSGEVLEPIIGRQWLADIAYQPTCGEVINALVGSARATSGVNANTAMPGVLMSPDVGGITALKYAALGGISSNVLSGGIRLSADTGILTGGATITPVVSGAVSYVYAALHGLAIDIIASPPFIQVSNTFRAIPGVNVNPVVGSPTAFNCSRTSGWVGYPLIGKWVTPSPVLPIGTSFQDPVQGTITSYHSAQLGGISSPFMPGQAWIYSSMTVTPVIGFGLNTVCGSAAGYVDAVLGGCYAGTIAGAWIKPNPVLPQHGFAVNAYAGGYDAEILTLCGAEVIVPACGRADATVCAHPSGMVVSSYCGGQDEEVAVIAGSGYSGAISGSPFIYIYVTTGGMVITPCGSDQDEDILAITSAVMLGSVIGGSVQVICVLAEGSADDILLGIQHAYMLIEEELIWETERLTAQFEVTPTVITWDVAVPQYDEWRMAA